MSKRLEEIMHEAKRTTNAIELITKIPYKDFLYLHEQAERVQELESDSYNAHLERLLDRKYQEIERYRVAIEFGIEYLKNSDIRQVQLVVTALKSALEESE